MLYKGLKGAASIPELQITFSSRELLMPRLKPRAFSCIIQKFFSLPCFYTKVFLEVANLVLGNRKYIAHNWSLNLPTLY